MAGLFDFQFEGSQTPESIRRAIEAEKAYRAANAAKLPLGVEGSGVSEGVRKAAQAALEKGAMPRIPNAPVDAPSAWEAGSRTVGDGAKGLFGKVAGAVGKGAGVFGRALGPVAAGVEGVDMLNQKFGPAAYANLENAMEEGRTRQAMKDDPELASRGEATADRIADNAMEGVRGLIPAAQATGLTDAELAAENPNGLLAAAEAEQAPQQSPMDVPVAEAEPQSTPEAIKHQQVQQETQRQVIEQETVKKLTAGDLSRPKAAEAVVNADLQRSGKQVTPEAKQELVTTEIKGMKNMDNSQLGTYLSYALMAGGVAAVFLDKSGKSADAFAGSFQRGMAGRKAEILQQQKLGLAAAKEAREAAVEQAKLKQTDTRNGIYGQSVDQDGEHKVATRELTAAAQEATQEHRKAELGLGYQRIRAADARSATSNSIRERQLASDAEWKKMSFANKDEDQALAREALDVDKQDKALRQARASEKNLIEAAKAAKTGGPKGLKVPTKDAANLAKQVADSQGLNLDEASEAAVAEQYKVVVQNDPAAAQDPIGTVKKILSGPNYQSKPAAWYGNGTTKIRRPKE